MDPSSPSAEIAREYLDRGYDAEIGGIVALFGLLAFFFFLGYLQRHLRNAEGEGGWLASVVYAGGLLTIGVFLGSLAIEFATGSIEQVSDAETAKTLFIIQWGYVVLFAPPLIALTLGTSIIALRHRALPKWLGWVGLLVALTLLMPWAGALIALGWVAVTSTILFLKTTSWEKNVR